MPDIPVTSAMITPTIGQYPTSSAPYSINSNADYTPDGDYDDGLPYGPTREQIRARSAPKQPVARQPQRQPIMIPSGFLSESPLVRRVPVRPERSATPPASATATRKATPTPKRVRKSRQAPSRFSLFGW